MRRHWYSLRVLEGRIGRRWAQALFTVVNGFVTIGLLAALARFTGEPYLFPSLGPTAIILFVTPEARVAAPRHVVLGHLLGVLCGYGALWVTGLQGAQPTFEVGVTAARVVAAAIALASTGGAMVAFDCQHPPAGATTLIVALGIMTQPAALAVLMAAVVLLTLQAVAINRLAGLHYPLWRPSGSEGRR